MSNIDRRAVLAGLTATAATSAAAIAAEPDPIFAAIERHRVLYAEQERREDIEESDGPTAVDKAEDDFLDILPTTVAGVAAMLSYSAEFFLRAGSSIGIGDYYTHDLAGRYKICGFNLKHGVNWEVMLQAHLAKALERIAQAGRCCTFTQATRS